MFFPRVVFFWTRTFLNLLLWCLAHLLPGSNYAPALYFLTFEHHRQIKRKSIKRLKRKFSRGNISAAKYRKERCTFIFFSFKIIQVFLLPCIEPCTVCITHSKEQWNFSGKKVEIQMGKCNLAAPQPLKLENCPNPIFIKGIIAENVLEIGCPTPSIFFWKIKKK